MSNMNRDLVFMMLQFLNEEQNLETMHKLEKESGVFFNSTYFYQCITNGEWEEVENYLSGFTKVDDNYWSMTMFFEILRQKYLEALDSRDDAKAVQILKKDLQVFSKFCEDICMEFTSLLALKNFRENEKFSTYIDATSARARLVIEMEGMIRENPLLCHKCEFHSFGSSRLRSLTTQSCSQSNSALMPPPVVTAPTNNGPIVRGFQRTGAPGLAPSSFNASPGGWMTELTQMGQPAVSGGLTGLALPHSSGSAFQIVDSEHVVKRPKPIRISEMNGDGQSLTVEKSRIPVDLDMSKIWNPTEINKPSQLQLLKLPDTLLSIRVMKLAYTNSGGAVLALLYNAIHKQWKWQSIDQNPAGKATTTVPPQLLHSTSGNSVMNDISGTNLKEAIPCFALAKNERYAMSASGGQITLFDVVTFKIIKTFMTPSPAATSFAFHPQDNNVIAIGMEDYSIQIYNVLRDEVIRKLEGHQSKVTGLAFSQVLNVLVSSGADAQLCVWDTDGWQKKASNSVLVPSGGEPNPSAKTRVQFHNDQTHMLVVHATRLAIYDAAKLEFIKQWPIPLKSCGAITDAAFSCDSNSVYASFQDGSICVLRASPLRLKCRIFPTAYLPSNIRPRPHALAIAAHPQDPNQFAVGLTDGRVVVMEPLQSKGTWGTVSTYERGCSSSAAGPSHS